MGPNVKTNMLKNKYSHVWSSWLYEEYSEQSINDSVKMGCTCKYYFQNIFNFLLLDFYNLSYIWTMKNICFERIKNFLLKLFLSL